MKKIYIIVIVVVIIAAAVYLVLKYAKSPSVANEKFCVVDEDCAVFGKDGDCNCGCFNTKHNWEKEGDCFCSAPKSCKCVKGVCEGVFEEQKPEGWETYIDEELSVEISHPSEMTVGREAGGIKFVFIGPTQSTGTELYDGIIFYIFRKTYEQDSLKKFAEAEIEEEKKNEVSVVKDLEEWSLGGLSGYSYEMQGLGIFANIIIDDGLGKAIRIIYLAPDPQNLGFQDTVNKMLATLKSTSSN